MNSFFDCFIFIRRFLSSCSCNSNTVWMHHINDNKTYEAKGRWELQKNITCGLEQIHEATPNKTAAVWPVNSHFINHPIKWTNHAENYERSKDELKIAFFYGFLNRDAPVLANQQIYIHQLFGNIGGSARSKDDRNGWQDRIKELYAVRVTWWWWQSYFGGGLCIMVIVTKMESATRVQILEKFVYVSLCANALWKGKNTFVLPYNNG